MVDSITNRPAPTDGGFGNGWVSDDEWFTVILAPAASWP